MTTAKRYRLSPSFWHDHVRRDLNDGTTVSKSGRYCVYVDLDRAGYDELLSDAQHYVKMGVAEFGPELRSLIDSAKRTVKVLNTEGPPQQPLTPTIDENTPVKTARFGWCTPGPEANHSQCRVEFHSVYVNALHRCSCECHQNGQ